MAKGLPRLDSGLRARHSSAMADEPNKKPDPIEDVRKGLGLLFRAAKNAASELPTGKLEDALMTGVREVGRAVENVASTIEREVFGAKHTKSAKDESAKVDEQPAPHEASAASAASSAQDVTPTNPTANAENVADGDGRPAPNANANANANAENEPAHQGADVNDGPNEET